MTSPLAKVVARRYLEAGTLQVPPVLHKTVYEWVLGVVIESRLSVVREAEGETSNSVWWWSEFEKTLQRLSMSLQDEILKGKPRGSWNAYKLFVQYAKSSVGDVAGTIKAGEFSAAFKDGSLSTLVLKETTQVRTEAHDRYLAMKKRLWEIQRRLAALEPHAQKGAQSARSSSVRIEIPFDTSGWAYTKFRNIRDFLPSMAKQYKDLLGPLAEVVKIEGADGVARSFEEALENVAHTWKSIKVEVVPKTMNGSLGSWNPDSKVLTVGLPKSVFFPPEAVFPVELEASDLNDIVRHELQHVVQSYLANALKGLAYNPRNPAGPGLPTKRERTPQFTQDMDDWTLVDKLRLHRDLKQQGVENASTIRFHPLDDVEFQTLLTDAKETLKSFFTRWDLDPNRVLRIFVGLEARPTEPGDSYRMVPVNSFMVTLKRVPAAAAKYRHALRELSKVVTSLT